MTDKLVTIAHFTFPVESFIPGNAVTQMVDPSGLYGARLQVREEDAERARTILSEKADY